MKRQLKSEPDKSILYLTNKPKQSFSGKTPNILIGSFAYPHISSGALVDEEYKEGSDDPKTYLEKNISIQDILQNRRSFVNSMTRVDVKDLKKKFVEQTQEIAKSSRAVDADVQLQRPLLKRMEFHEKALPHGPSAQLKQLDITSNPKIKSVVEQKTSDTDLKANSALLELQERGIDEYQLTKLLSTGTLGIGDNRKLVPTKWSITAVDDQLGEQLRKEILDYSFCDFELYEGNYIGNYYVVVFLPGDWSFELLEYTCPETIYNPGQEASVTKDFEFLHGRTSYAYETAGGYYASRLAVLRQLASRKRQGRVVVFRVITNEYIAPLGVWTLRETVHKTVNSTPLLFESQEELYTAVQDKLKQLTVLKPQELIAMSTILFQEQASLKKWMSTM
jgi:DNA repair protein NreA